MEKKTYEKLNMKVISLSQENHLMVASDPTTNEVNATRNNYMGGAAWEWM